MRKVIFGGANSLDNYFARENGRVDWLLWSDEVMELMKDMWSRFDTIVMGRRTWQTSMEQFSEEDLEKARAAYSSGTKNMSSHERCPKDRRSAVMRSLTPIRANSSRN